MSPVSVIIIIILDSLVQNVYVMYTQIVAFLGDVADEILPIAIDVTVP